MIFFFFSLTRSPTLVWEVKGTNETSRELIEAKWSSTASPSSDKLCKNRIVGGSSGLIAFYFSKNFKES